jgi:hypothetical protein
MPEAINTSDRKGSGNLTRVASLIRSASESRVAEASAKRLLSPKVAKRDCSSAALAAADSSASSLAPIAAVRPTNSSI